MIYIRYIFIFVLFSPDIVVSQLSDNSHRSIFLKGVVQTSGLLETDKTRFNINSDFQIITDSIPYFLISDLDLSAFWGQCVKVKGKILEGWQDYPSRDRDKFTFGRSAIVLDEITLEKCNLERSNNYFDCKRDTVSGTIVRRKRLAPDISYDYTVVPIQKVKLRFEPMFDQHDFPFLHSMDVEKINYIIETGISNIFCGCFTGGYAEMIVFKLDHIIE